ncbi:MULTISPECIES: hypothetical protein [unclassified Nocardioides]|uniref:hypothetical protein n=1 Tax=unclassified Nocardioides TaxID=2615069 RepID=UPI00031FF61B|nr:MULTISPECIES: hypothetical protein [unclassified Nocardioides]
MTSLSSVRRTLAALAAVPLLLTGLAACGDDPGPTAAQDPAGTSALGAPAADLAPGTDVDPADFADLLAAGVARMDTAHLTMRSEMGSAGAMTGEGDADYRGDRPVAQLTITSDFVADAIEARIVDGALYLDLGHLSHDKFWKLDLDDPDSPLGALGSQLDPRSAVDIVAKGLERVTYVGPDGDLDHYRASVDPQAVLDAVGGLGPMGTQADGTPAMPKTLDYELWLDDQGRVTRLTSTMGDLGSVEMTMSDFGADVSVEAPPADQVTDMPSMFDHPGTEPQA